MKGYVAARLALGGEKRGWYGKKLLGHHETIGKEESSVAVALHCG
jgi:hypothetical protein